MHKQAAAEEEEETECAVAEVEQPQQANDCDTGDGDDADDEEALAQATELRAKARKAHAKAHAKGLPGFVKKLLAAAQPGTSGEVDEGSGGDDEVDPRTGQRRKKKKKQNAKKRNTGMSGSDSDSDGASSSDSSDSEVEAELEERVRALCKVDPHLEPPLTLVQTLRGCRKPEAYGGGENSREGEGGGEDDALACSLSLSHALYVHSCVPTNSTFPHVLADAHVLGPVIPPHLTRECSPPFSSSFQHQVRALLAVLPVAASLCAARAWHRGVDGRGQEPQEG